MFLLALPHPLASIQSGRLRLPFPGKHPQNAAPELSAGLTYTMWLYSRNDGLSEESSGRRVV